MFTFIMEIVYKIFLYFNGMLIRQIAFNLEIIKDN